MNPRPIRLLLAVLLMALGGSAIDAVLNLGDSFEGEICKANEVDVLRFDALQTTKLNLVLDAQPLFTPLVQVFDLSTGLTVGELSTTGPSIEMLTQNLPSTGAYEIRISSADGSTGTYSLSTDKRLPDRLVKISKLKPVEAGSVWSLRFDALAGFILNAEIRPGSGSDAIPANARMFGPGGPVSLTGFVLPQVNAIVIRDLPLGLTTLGAFTLVADNIGGPGSFKSFLNLKETTKPKSVSELDSCSTFGPEQIVGSQISGASDVDSGDLDGDGDTDLVVASPVLRRVFWHRNKDGLGDFSSGITIHSGFSFDQPSGVHVSDLDGDGDRDVLVSWRSLTVTAGAVGWFQNGGAGNFGSKQGLNFLANKCYSATSADLDGDGDRDVLAGTQASFLGFHRVAYNKNDGFGNFGSEQIVTSDVLAVRSVHAADLDGDGDPDVLSASLNNDTVAWNRNIDGSDAFGPNIAIATDALAARQVSTADIDHDGDLDVLSASSMDDTIAWYENTDGLGSFGPKQAIDVTANGARSVATADIDSDGFTDVLSASFVDDSVSWYRNTDGLGGFASRQIITANSNGAQVVHPTDIDGDQDPDIAVASANDNTLSWFENIELANNFLLLVGSGPGTAWAQQDDQLLATQLDTVLDVLPVKEGLTPSFRLLEAVGTPQGRQDSASTTLSAAARPWKWGPTFTLQLVSMPDEHGTRPALHSAGLAVHLLPDGTLFSQTYGAAQGLRLRAEIEVDSSGAPSLSFPFERLEPPASP